MGDSIEIREVASVTVSFNHDLVDGAPAARCINALRRFLEHPEGIRQVLAGS